MNTSTCPNATTAAKAAGKPTAEFCRELSEMNTTAVLEKARRAKLPTTRAITVREGGRERCYNVTRHGWGPVPTDFGEFQHVVFRVDDCWQEYHCLVKADSWTEDFRPRFKERQSLLLRLDSACVGGMLFNAIDCDCRAQLMKAEEEISRKGEGIIIHISGQDGRGKGTDFKLATQILQKEVGYDTVQAACALAEGLDIDARTYGGAVAVLKFILGSQQKRDLDLLSGNPQKVEALTENGFCVKRKPPVVPATPETIRHLRAKAFRLAHMIPSIAV